MHITSEKCSQALTTKEQNVHGASKEKLQAGKNFEYTHLIKVYMTNFITSLDE